MASPPQLTSTSSLACAKAPVERSSIGVPASTSAASCVNCRREISPRTALADSVSMECFLVSLIFELLVMSVPLFVVAFIPVVGANFAFVTLVVILRPEGGNLFPQAMSAIRNFPC